MHSTRTSVFCVSLSIFIAVASCVHADPAWEDPTWYNPLFTPNEEGQLLDISLELENGKSIPRKIFRQSDEQILAVQVPRNVNLKALVPEFKVTDGFTIDSKPQGVQDFTQPVTYTLNHKKSTASVEWQVNVFNADTAKIFSGKEFKQWKLLAHGYDRAQSSDYLDNTNGLFFGLAKPLERGSWALFYHDNYRPIQQVNIKFTQLVEHHEKWLQILDLAAVDSKAWTQKDWSQGNLKDTEDLVRWSERLPGATGVFFVQKDVSQNPVNGPIAIRYGGGKITDRNYRIHVKKVWLRFSSDESAPK